MGVRTGSRWYLVLFWLLAGLSVCSTIACRPKPPIILVFSATPSEVTLGEPTTLKWVIDGVTTVTIDQGVGSVAAVGQITLSPDKTIAYTLTATNTGGTVTKSVVVHVSAPPPPPVDTIPPIIANVSVTSKSETKAVISWTTNEPSSGQVEYGLTTDYGSTATSETELTTTHSVTLTELQPNTSYNYRVKSKDKAGNEALSANYTFVTPAPKSPYVLELQWLEWGRRTESILFPGIEPTNVKKFLFIKGAVRNNSQASLRAVMCTMNCWSGSKLVKYETYVYRSPLLPGRVFEFDIQTADDPSVDNVTVDFADSLGQEIRLIEK